MIQNELCKVEGLSNDFVQKGNLRSMSTKQFILIMIHLLKPIVRKTEINTTNYVEVIYELMTSLEYPYTINKSWLKTPNAPHCQNHIIVLLSWLLDFSLVEDDCPIAFVQSEDVSPEFMKIFHEKCQIGYKKWNSGLDQEYEDINKEIYKSYLLEKTGNYDIEGDLRAIRSEYEKLQETKRPISLEINYKQLLAEHKNLTEKYDSLINQYNEKIRVREAVKQDLNHKKHSYEIAIKEIATLKQKISEQILKVDTKTQLLQESSQMKELLEVKLQTIMELNDASSDQEILLSRLLNKKLTLVDHLNNLIHKIYNDLNSANLAENLCGGNFRPEICEIKMGPDTNQSINDQLSRLMELFNRLNRELSVIAESLKSDCSGLESAKTLMDSENERISAQLANMEMKRDALQTERDNLLMEFKQIPSRHQHDMQKIKERIESLTEKIRTSKKAIEKLEQENALKKISNKQFCDKASAKYKEVIAKRQENHDQMSRWCDSMEKGMGELEMMIENSQKS